jgi:putative DNA primase/helicase
MQQAWAQVYEQMFKGKDSPQWWLTDAEQIQLEKLNARHKKRTAIDDLLDVELQFEEPKERWVRLSASEVLKAVGIERPTNPQAKECANFLRQHFGQPTRSQGKTRWLVPPTNDEFLKQSKNTQNDEDDDEKY